jgi:hypothetical protein
MGNYQVDCNNCKSMTKQFKDNWYCKHEHMEFETSYKCFNKMKPINTLHNTFKTFL